MFERYQEANQKLLENLFSLDFPNDTLLMYPVYSYFGASLAIGLVLGIVLYFWYKKNKLNKYPALKGALLVLIFLMFLISLGCLKYSLAENNKLIVGDGVVKVGRGDNLHILNKDDVNLINLEKDGSGNCQITLYTYGTRHFIKIPIERTNIVRARDCNVFSRMSPNEFKSVAPVIDIKSIEIIKDVPEVMDVDDITNIEAIEPGVFEQDLMGPPIELMNKPGDELIQDTELSTSEIDFIENDEELVVDFIHGVLVLDDELESWSESDDVLSSSVKNPSISTENPNVEPFKGIVVESESQDDLDRKLLEIIEKENARVDTVSRHESERVEEISEIPPRFEGKGKLKIGSDELIQSIINSK